MASAVLNILTSLPYQQIADELGKVENEPDPELKKLRLENQRIQQETSEWDASREQRSLEADENLLKSIMTQQGDAEFIETLKEIYGKNAEDVALGLPWIRQGIQNYFAEPSDKQTAEMTEEEQYARNIAEINKELSKDLTPEQKEKFEKEKEILLQQKKDIPFQKAKNINQGELDEVTGEYINKNQSNEVDKGDLNDLQLLKAMNEMFGRQQQQQQQQQHQREPKEELEYYELELDSNYSDERYSTAYTRKNYPVFYLDRKLDDIVAMKVLEVNIPNSYYNLSYLRIGDTIGFPEIRVREKDEFDDVLKETTITIPNGYYSVSSLIITFFDLLDTARIDGLLTDSYSIALNSSTQKITITSDNATLDQHFSMTFYNNSYLFGFEKDLEYNSIYYGGPSSPCTLTGGVVYLNPLYYLINSRSLGSLVNIFFPNSTLSLNNNNLVISKIGVLNTTFGESTQWQEPCPDKWFDVSKINLNQRLDFFISTNLDPNNVLDFNNQGFSIKLGLMRKVSGVTDINNYGRSSINQSINKSIVDNTSSSKYWLDTSREGWWKEDSTGYRDPNEFGYDELDRQYIMAQQQQKIKKRKRI